MRLRFVATVICFSLCACSSMLYYPSHEIYKDPHALGVPYDDLWFQSSKGIKLNGWYFAHRGGGPANGVLVFFHGNGGNMTSHYLTLVWILEAGYDFFIFDYEGYGQSEGSPSPEATVDDGRAAIGFIHQKNPSLPLIVFGQSLGGAVALRSVIDLHGAIPIKSVVVESAFYSYKAVGRDVLARHWLTWILQPLTYVLLSDKYGPGDEIGKIAPIPLTVIHGDKDKVVSFELGKKVFELASEPKEFWPVSGGGHIEAFWGRHNGEFKKKLLERLK